MKPSIVFFGTGPVSLHCLEGIHKAFTVEAIITKPDRSTAAAHHHNHPVKRWGQEHAVTVHQVGNKDELDALATHSNWESQVGLVVDFGLMIPPPTIKAFRLGIVNSHFSLLPALRGADPITFAILEGLRQTGVSLMRIVPELDAGPLLAQASYTLPPDITTPQLTEALGKLSNQLLIERLPHYINGALTPYPQPMEGIGYTRKLTKSDGIIDWHKPAVRLEREIRAYLGWPGSRTTLFGRELTVTQARVEDALQPGRKHGEPCIVNGEIWVQANPGILVITRLKPAGKREMDAADFLRGQRSAS